MYSFCRRRWRRPRFAQLIAPAFFWNKVYVIYIKKRSVCRDPIMPKWWTMQLKYGANGRYGRGFVGGNGQSAVWTLLVCRSWPHNYYLCFQNTAVQCSECCWAVEWANMDNIRRDKKLYLYGNPIFIFSHFCKTAFAGKNAFTKSNRHPPLPGNKYLHASLQPAIQPIGYILLMAAGNCLLFHYIQFVRQSGCVI